MVWTNESYCTYVPRNTGYFSTHLLRLYIMQSIIDRFPAQRSLYLLKMQYQVAINHLYNKLMVAGSVSQEDLSNEIHSSTPGSRTSDTHAIEIWRQVAYLLSKRYNYFHRISLLAIHPILQCTCWQYTPADNFPWNRRSPTAVLEYILLGQCCASSTLYLYYFLTPFSHGILY